jgi:hypothetical protein
MQDGMGKTCGTAVETAGHKSLVGNLYERRQCSRQCGWMGRIHISHREIGLVMIPGVLQW